MGSSNRNIQTMALSLMFPEYACSSRPFAIHRPAFSRSAIQLAEDEDGYRLSARVPGVAAAGVKVTVTDDAQLHIVAKSDSDETVIKRTMALPSDADPSTLNASCVDGVLEVQINKLPVPEPAQIEVAATSPVPLEDPDTAYEFRRALPGIPAPMEDGEDEEAHVSLATLRVPGYSANDIKLMAHEGRLSLEVSHKGDKSADYWLLLPEELKDPSNLVAVCQDGILHIKYPKEELQQRVERSVEVSATRAEINLAKDVDMQQ